jgi:hypothetical protein
MKLKLFLLSQEENNDYDTFDSVLVCAENEEEAKKIDPRGEVFKENNDFFGCWAYSLSGITCVEIGEANEHQTKGVIIASFNAG